MSAYLNLEIDFSTGDFILIRQSGLPNLPPPDRRVGRVSGRQIEMLRGEARAAIKARLMNRECRATARRNKYWIDTPNIDSHPIMAVTLAGQTTTAPINVSCWSNAANRLASAAVALVDAAG